MTTAQGIEGLRSTGSGVEHSPIEVSGLECRPEAIHMDGQQRLLLQQTWEVLSADENFSSEAAKATAVMVGIGTVEYNTIAGHLGPGIYVATGEIRLGLQGQ